MERELINIDFLNFYQERLKKEGFNRAYIATINKYAPLFDFDKCTDYVIVFIDGSACKWENNDFTLV